MQILFFCLFSSLLKSCGQDSGSSGGGTSSTTTVNEYTELVAESSDLTDFNVLNLELDTTTASSSSTFEAKNSCTKEGQVLKASNGYVGCTGEGDGLKLYSQSVTPHPSGILYGAVIKFSKSDNETEYLGFSLFLGDNGASYGGGCDSSEIIGSVRNSSAFDNSSVSNLDGIKQILSSADNSICEKLTFINMESLNQVELKIDQGSATFNLSKIDTYSSSSLR